MPQTLLLADDSVTIQRVIELTFADEDTTSPSVTATVRRRLDSLPPDIVLVDVGMPGKTGYEVAAYMKQSPRLSHIPVVLLTGAFEPVDAARAAGAGCDGVLAKPFEPRQVIGRVKELLGRPVRPIGSRGRLGAQSARRGAESRTGTESGRSPLTTTSTSRRGVQNLAASPRPLPSCSGRPVGTTGSGSPRSALRR